MGTFPVFHTKREAIQVNTILRKVYLFFSQSNTPRGIALNFGKRKHSKQVSKQEVKSHKNEVPELTFKPLKHINL